MAKMQEHPSTIPHIYSSPPAASYTVIQVPDTLYEPVLYLTFFFPNASSKSYQHQKCINFFSNLQNSVLISLHIGKAEFFTVLKYYTVNVKSKIYFT